MKFNPTWQQIALLVVLLAAPVVANLIAPGVVAAISSMVSTVFGALFVNLRDPKDPPGGGTGDGGGTALKVIAGGISAAFMVFALAGCALFESGHAARPAAYATELAACQEQSKTWEEYLPCCEDVARRYGRDAGAC